MIKKENLLYEINKIYSCNLQEMGFYPNKKQDVYVKKKGFFKFLIEIKISENNKQHIVLNIQHEKINKIFKDTIVEAKKYNEKTVVPKGSISVCSLTDWKKLYQNQNLNIGNIWFSSIFDLDTVKKRKDEYIQAFELANNWFEINDDLTCLYSYNFNEKYTYNVEVALCIGYFLKKDIVKDYDNFKMENKNIGNWDEGRVDTFIEYLMR